MEKREDFAEFDVTDKYKHQIDIWYRTYNISREKIEFYYDVLVSLYELVDKTYLGIDVLYKEGDQFNHFNWCWDKTIDNLSKERIYFKEKGPHYEYLWNLFYEAYYTVRMDEQEPKIREFLYKLFDFRHKKTRSELDILTEIYRLLDQNLKK